MSEKVTTVPVSLNTNSLILKLAAKKAVDLNLSKLSRTAYVEMIVKSIANNVFKESDKI